MLMRMMQGMNAKMEENTNEMKEEINGIKKGMEANTNGMREEMKEMRGEMQQIGQCLQAGMKAIACSETRTARKKWRRHVLGRAS